MLKIKAPIRTKLSTPMLTVGEGFAKRIIGNYELFDLTVTGEDFMHLLTSPPEVFLMEEGGNVSVSSSTDVRETNIKKIEIINNFLNRVALSDTVNLTYQDRVFITDVLHKLGITETASFMKRVENIKNEQKDFSERLNAYWNHSEEMRALVEEYISSSQSRTDESFTQNTENINTLHQEIFKRLQTGSVYQILSNFYQEERGVSEITGREIILSEQKETAEKLLLQSLINEVRGEELPLIYRHDNYYESEAALPEEGEEDANKSITAAALLSVIRAAQVSRREENISYKNQWYEVAGNLYRSEENTFRRITENLHRNMTLIEEGMLSPADVWNVDFSNINREELLEEIDVRTENLQRFVTEEGDRTSFNIIESADNREFTETDITNIKGDEYSERTDVENKTDVTVDNSKTNLLRRQLTQNIEENNRQMRATYEAHLNALTNNYMMSAPRKTASEIEAAQIAALKNPVEFMKEFRKEGQAAEERRREFDRKRSELVLTQSPDAFTVIQQFLEHPEIIPEGVTITRNDIGSLLYDSRQVENSYKEIERKLNISEERLKTEEERSFERTELTNLSSTAITDREETNISLAESEHVSETADRRHSLTEKERTLNLSDERIQRLENLGFTQRELINLNETDLNTISENSFNRAVIEHVIENRELQVNALEREENILRSENKTINTIERELERARLTHTAERQRTEQDLRTIENLNLVHKKQETGIDEEIINAIQSNRLTKTETTEHHMVEERHVTDEKTINTVVDQRLREQERRLDELIQEGMTRQMNTISDRVYRQIEKRLANERSRRGV